MAHVLASYSKGQIVDMQLHEVEAPTRIAKQLTKLLLGITRIRGRSKATIEDYKTIIRVIKDTAIPEYQLIMNQFLQRGVDTKINTYNLSTEANMHYQTTQNKIEIMKALGILQAEHA